MSPNQNNNSEAKYFFSALHQNRMFLNVYTSKQFQSLLSNETISRTMCSVEKLISLDSV